MSILRLYSLAAVLALSASLKVQTQTPTQGMRFGLVEVGQWVIYGPAPGLPAGRTSTTSGTTTVTFTQDKSTTGFISQATTQRPSAQSPILDPWENMATNVPSPPELPPLGSICPLVKAKSSSSPGTMLSVTSQMSTPASSSSSSSSSSAEADPRPTSEPEEEPPNDDGEPGAREAVAAGGTGEGGGAVEGITAAAAAGAAAVAAGFSNAADASNQTGSSESDYTMAHGSSNLPTAKIMNTQSTILWSYGISVDAANFAGLLDQVQAAVNGGQAATDGKPFAIVRDDLKFNYTVVPGAGKSGTSAFNGTVALFQWFRFDGGSNLATGYINDAERKMVARVGLWQANSTMDLCCR